jgi:hypothetical protein
MKVPYLLMKQEVWLSPKAASEFQPVKAGGVTQVPKLKVRTAGKLNARMHHF